MGRVWDSVVKQTHKDWEWIIVNDGSSEVRKWYTDNIAKFRKVNRDIWMIDIERNRGRFGLFARNIGTMASSSEYVVFLDDDNEWEEDHLESLIRFRKKHCSES